MLLERAAVLQLLKKRLFPVLLFPRTDSVVLLPASEWQGALCFRRKWPADQEQFRR